MLIACYTKFAIASGVGYAKAEREREKVYKSQTLLVGKDRQRSAFGR